MGRPLTEARSFTSLSWAFTWSMTSVTYCSRAGWRSAVMRAISSYRNGYRVAKARSSSSHLIWWMPSRLASGA